MPRIKLLNNNFDSSLARGAGAAGYAGADAAKMIVGLGTNMIADKAKKRAFKLEKKKYNLNHSKYNDEKFNLIADKATKEDERKRNIDEARKYFVSIGIKGAETMSDDYIFYNGKRLQKIYDDETNRKTPTFYNTKDGIVAAYMKDGKPFSEIVFANPKTLTKEQIKKQNLTKDRIRVNYSDADNYENVRNIGDERWVIKSEYDEREKARKLGKKEIK